MPEPHSEPEEPGPDETRGLAAVEAHLRIYLTDSSLWPVLVAAVAAFATFGSALLWLVFVGRNPFAMAALAILALVCGDVWQRDLRRTSFGTISRLLLGFWVVSGGGALWLAYLTAA